MPDALPPPNHTPPAATPAALAARLAAILQEARQHHGEDGRIQHGYLHAQWGDAYFDGVILKLGQLHHLQLHLTPDGERHRTQVSCEPLTSPAELDPWVRVPSQRVTGEYHALRYTYECVPAEGGHTARRRPNVDTLHPIVNGQPDWETVSAVLNSEAPAPVRRHATRHLLLNALLFVLSFAAGAVIIALLR